MDLHLTDEQAELLLAEPHLETGNSAAAAPNKPLAGRRRCRTAAAGRAGAG
jgi:hypothetical protein